MARVIDVIEYPNEMEEEIVHRFPEEGGEADYRIGSQVIVREAQRVVFFRDGAALDVFGPGRHTIATANVPLLTQKLQDWFTSGKTVFPAEVFFVSMKEFANRKWGTPQPIIVRNPGMGLGVALLQGFGTYSYQIGDPQQFVTQLVGAQSTYNTDQIEDRVRTILLSILQDVLGETTEAKSVVDLIGLTEELGAAVRAKAQDDFEAIGMTLKSFYIGNLKPSSKSAQELRDMGMLDMATYTQLQAADAMRDAAQNPSGGAGLTAGIGAGMGVGDAIRQAVQQRPPDAQGGAQAVKKGMPNVMTPSEAAEVLRVSEEDVVAAIEAGDLKAKKLGKAYRISKGAMEEFLNS